MADVVDVLIVEDVETMRGLLEHVLEGIPGIRVSGKSRNAWEARLELQRRRPGLVLLDEILPGESSLDLLAEIRRLGIPTLLLTGVRDPEHPMAEGAAGRLFKPTWDSLASDRQRFAKAIDAAIQRG